MLIPCRETELLAAFPVDAIQRKNKICSPITLPLLVVGVETVAQS